MRKLFSAATSLCMAATMVGAFAPATAVAADATKGFAIRTFADADLPTGATASGSTVTVSADAIAAGDVVIPVAIYLEENTPDTGSFSVCSTINSDNADVKNITFSQFKFDAAQTFTLASGDKVSTKDPLFFAGEYDDIDEVFSAAGLSTPTFDTKQDAYGVENAYASTAWAGGGAAYNWTGAASDTYPVLAYNVTLPQGTAAGDYTLDFVNVNTDKSGENINPSTMIEGDSPSTNGRFANYDGYLSNLNLTGLTITVEGETAVTTTTPAATTTAAQTTAATTTADSQPTTTTTVAGSTDVPDTSNANFVLDLTNDGDVWTANPGDTVKVPVKLTANGNQSQAFVLFFEMDAPITLKQFGKTSPAYNGATLSINLDDNTCNAVTLDGSAGIVAEDGSTLVTAVFQVPEDCADGKYKITINEDTVQFNKDAREGSVVFYDNIVIIPGYIQVGEGETEVTTTTQAATTTAAATTTTTTTTAATTAATTTAATTAATTTAATTAATTTTVTSVQTSVTTAPAQTTTEVPATTPATTVPAGTLLYGDTNVDGKVNIADVVVLNKWLNDNSAYAIKDQGKVNADCFNPKGGAELTVDDSDAIIKSIVHLVTLPVEG